MCSVDPPPAPRPPPKPPRLVDRAVVQARLRGQQDLARGGFIGTLTSATGVTGPANVLRAALVGTS